MVLAGLVLGPAVSVAAGDGLFHSIEVVNDDMRVFTRWTGVLQRMEAERAAAHSGGLCRTADYDACGADRWAALIEPLRDLEPLEQIRRVNAILNRIQYVQDDRNWGVPDYWETPGQFLTRNGDCEDYAIAKYAALRDLGWPVDSLRIVVLQDMNLNIPHAVLAVRLEPEWYILDNQISVPMTDDRIKHYRPVYSINEERWWRHVMRRQP